MKITFVLPYASFTGGIRVIAIYAARLQNLGHEVFVVSQPKPKPNLRSQFLSVIRGKGWIYTPEQTPSHFDNTNIAHRVIESVRPITDDDVPDADVVVATWWETATWVAELSNRKGAKAYFMQDYGFPKGIPGQKLEQIIPTWFLPLHIITIAPWMAKLIREHCGDIPVTVIPNAVELDLFKTPQRHKQEFPTVGLVYKTSLIKGTDIALEAIRIARKTIPQLRLLAFGSRKPVPSLSLPSKTVYSYQPSDREISSIYANCDMWLFSSRREGFGLPILEAMACRTPVVGTPAGAAPELISQGGGILVKPEDPEHMAQAILQICRLSDEQWQSMSQIAYTTATSYTWDDATKLFETALYSAIERSKPEKLANSS